MRMREATIAAGIWLTFGIGGFGEAYVALTWSRPHRLELALLFALAVAAATRCGLKTIAEWVEDAETLQLLSQLGADYAQGFYIGRPEPFAERPGDQSLPGRIQVPASARLRGRRPLARRVTSVGDRHA